MHHRRRRHLRNVYYYAENGDAQKETRNSSLKGLVALLTLFLICVFLACALSFMKELSSYIAVSDASDIITVQVNRAIAEIMAEGDYSGDYFVTFIKNESGDITAVNSNMARINSLSTQLLERIVGATGNRSITVSIPVGNLSGISLLMGKGPGIPIEIIVLTSSRVEFDNSVVTAGINQTNQKINLNVIVDIDILIPWDTISTQVFTQVLIADTVVVGRVPDTYLNMASQ